MIQKYKMNQGISYNKLDSKELIGEINKLKWSLINRNKQFVQI